MYSSSDCKYMYFQLILSQIGSEFLQQSVNVQLGLGYLKFQSVKKVQHDFLKINFHTFLQTNQIREHFQLFQLHINFQNIIKIMSKSHRQLVNKKGFVNTLYLHGHNRTRSKKFSKQIAIEPLLRKAKSHYHNNQLQEALECYEQIMYHTDTFIAEAWYFSALIHISQQKYAKSLKYLLQIHEKCGNFKDNTFLFIGICYKGIEQYDNALKFLDRSCKPQNGSADAYFLRSKINYKMQNYSQALNDLKRIITLGSNNQRINIFYCQTLIKCKRFNETKIHLYQLYEEMEKKQSSDNKKIVLRKLNNIKIYLLLSENKIQQAEKLCFNSLQEYTDSQMLFHRAKIHQYKGQKDQMLLAFNECLNLNANSSFMINALQQLIIFSMEQRDFYEAFQYTKRISFLKIQSKKLLQLSRLAEGVTFLMKKKFGEALLLCGAINVSVLEKFSDRFYAQLDIFQEINSRKKLNLLNLYNSSMGYAYFCQGQYHNALQKYRAISKDLNREDHMLYFYNIALCEGIQLYQNQKIEQSIKRFESATQYLMRPQPYFYIAVVLLNKHLSDQADSDFFMKIIQIVDNGMRIGENSQMYYYRSMVYLYLGMNAQAIDDIDKAIQKSEDNVAKYFYLRALIFFQQKNYDQAITEFSTAISIDENLIDAYLQRAKAKLLNEQIQQAYEDLKFHPMGQDWRSLFQLHQGNYDQIIEQKLADQRVMESAYFMLGKFSQAGPAGKIILALICENYSSVEDILNDALNIGFHVGSLEKDDLYTLKAYCCYKLNRYNQSIQNLQKAQDILRKSHTISYCQQQQKKLLAIKVNIILVTLINGDVQKSLQLCNVLINDVYQGTIYDQLVKLRNLMNTISEGSQNSQNLQDQSELQLFKTDVMLSNYFSNQKYKGIHFKFLVTFPKTKVVDIQTAPYEAPLISFTINNIDNRPQAPWMRRDENGVIFTSQIHNFDDLNLQTQQNQLQKLEKSKIKQQLQLDPQVLKKLEKLNKKVQG